MRKTIEDSTNSDLENSKVITLGDGQYPIIGVVGLVHGKEIVGRKVLDQLERELPAELKTGQVKLIYANLAAEKAGEDLIETNLNIAFPGKPNGTLEERTAFQLRSHLNGCHWVLDMHSTEMDYGAFVVSTSGLTRERIEEEIEYLGTHGRCGREPNPVTLAAYEGSEIHIAQRGATNIDAISALSRNTGLPRHIQMSDAVASGRSLIEFINAHGKGYAISFETGQHYDPQSVETGLTVVRNVLKVYGAIEGTPVRADDQETYLGFKAVQVPERVEGFRITDDLQNFQELPAGTPYAVDLAGNNYSLDRSCIPVLFNESKRESGDFRSGRVFIATQRISGKRTKDKS